MDQTQDSKAVKKARNRMTRLSESGAKPRSIRRAVNKLLKKIEAQVKQASEPEPVPVP